MEIFLEFCSDMNVCACVCACACGGSSHGVLSYSEEVDEWDRGTAKMLETLIFCKVKFCQSIP
jgi:hypothetical protein